MDNKIITGSKAWVIVLLTGLLAIFFFFYYFGHNDTLKLNGFSTAYRNYDRAILEYSNAVTALSPISASLPTEQEQQADQALSELKAKGGARLSSLTRNDAELMSMAVDIASLSSQELEALKAYQSAVVSQSGDLGTYAEQFVDLTNERQAAFAHYLQLLDQ